MSTATVLAEADPSAVSAAAAALISAQAIASAYDLTIAELQDLSQEPHFRKNAPFYFVIAFSGVCLLSAILLVFVHRREEKEGDDQTSYPTRTRRSPAWRKVFRAPGKAMLSAKAMRPGRTRRGPPSDVSYLSTRSSMPSEYLNVSKGQSSTTSLPFDSKV